MAIIEKIITLNDGSEFKFKYDDTPIETTGDNAYISENAKSNLYCAYRLDILNKVIPAHESSSKIVSASFNGYPENGFLFDNASLTWNINPDHFVTKSFFANTVFVWYDNSVPYIIVEIDTSRLLYNPTVTHTGDYYKLPMSEQSNTCIILSTDKKQRLNTINIAPYTIINNSNELYTFFTFQDVSNTINNTKSNSIESSYSNGFVHNRSTCINSEYTGEIYLALPENVEFVVGNTNGKTQTFPVNDDIDLYIKAGGNPSYKSARACNRLKTEHIVKYCLAGRGLAFLYNNTIIYPIINRGIVTGYTENINDSGDYKDYKGIHDHDVPTDSSSDEDDSETDMDVGSLYSASGMVHYYNVTSENLQNLSKLMSNADVVGTKNLLPNLISLKAFPISFDRLGRGVVKTIEIGGVEMTDSISGTAQGITVDSTYNFLSCCDTTVQGKYGNISSPHFLDFSPYTQVELILPLAGSVILPDNAMYKSLNIVYVYDIANGSAICVIKSNGTVISTIPCTLSQDVPFSAINVGAKTSAMISNITNVAQNLATLGVSVGTGNLVGGISSGIGTVGSIAQTVMSNNQNYIEKFGRTGDMCDFGLVKKAYIKYTRPVDIIPENFGRTNGYLCNVTKKLSDCSGFTMCENPEINCLGTENEKNEIKRLLESGVII